MENEIYTRFRALSEKSRLTAEEKAEIEEVAVQYGLSLDKKCSSCYRDAATQIAIANKPEIKPEDGEYELCDDIDITIESFRFGRLHVCPATCTDASARLWLEAGLPLRFFKRYPHADNTEN